MALVRGADNAEKLTSRGGSWAKQARANVQWTNLSPVRWMRSNAPFSAGSMMAINAESANCLDKPHWLPHRKQDRHTIFQADDGAVTKITYKNCWPA